MRPPYRFITIRELEYLKEKYPTEPTSRVAETLGKTNRVGYLYSSLLWDQEENKKEMKLKPFGTRRDCEFVPFDVDAYSTSVEGLTALIFNKERQLYRWSTRQRDRKIAEINKLKMIRSEIQGQLEQKLWSMLSTNIYQVNG